MGLNEISQNFKILHYAPAIGGGTG